MSRHRYFFATLLALVSTHVMAGEDVMPMHPGRGYNEVGIGVAVAPIRRATSEDPPPASRQPDRPLHHNKVTLKLPAPQNQGERRLRIVDVNNVDGVLDFDLEGAPLLDNNMDIPGLVSPEMLAMDKFNQMEPEPMWRPEPEANAGETRDDPFAALAEAEARALESDSATRIPALAALEPLEALKPLEPLESLGAPEIGPSLFPDTDEQIAARRIVIGPDSTVEASLKPAPRIEPPALPEAAFRPGESLAFIPVEQPLAPSPEVEIAEAAVEPAESLKPPTAQSGSLRPPSDMTAFRPSVEPPPAQRIEQPVHVAAKPVTTGDADLVYVSSSQAILGPEPETDLVPMMTIKPSVRAQETPIHTSYPPAATQSTPARVEAHYAGVSAPDPDLFRDEPAARRPDRHVVTAYEIPTRRPAEVERSRDQAEYTEYAAAKPRAEPKNARKPAETMSHRNPKAGPGRKAAEVSVNVPAAGATRRPRFRQGVAHFDASQRADAPDQDSMREFESVLSPIRQRGGRP